ncbi:hypothetical protein [Frigoriglobus tundricola]|uniref:Uncharacterized protein n=1 Tax=Frigoriglobus tundricola TaxID=2774151 RepID=A0A6M5Z2H7_9BACT|nr:hypothetical protein [Frigoriglobus tundricola]QJW99392.1 hypothetical protein FTUN_7004 [Frigoriglobus tundricola]
MPRLTLRTLLAYIDDTLEPTEARSLGKKVAESEEAQQLVERIKKVTRRRGLATPESSKSDDATADPNTVAEYLDNALDSATLKQVEETCLESDVHLAEVAACHQILTLVLTEPVRVPPHAHRRMYGLVSPPASIPSRRPNKTLPIGGAAPPTADQPDADDADAALLLGMKRYSAATTWAARFALFGAAAVLLLMLTASAYWSLPGHGPKAPEANPGHSSVLLTPPEPKPSEKEPAPKTGVDTPPPKPADRTPAGGIASLTVATLVDDAGSKKPTEPLPPQVAKQPEPLGGESPIGKVETLRQLVVVQSPTGDWLRSKVDAADEGEVPANAVVMALPGYKANLLLDTKVQVHLWGNVPEQVPYRVFESRVKFHPPAAGFDADITLLGGRIYLKNKKVDAERKSVPAKVRVRFPGEVWDITLPDGNADALVELISWFEPGTPYARTGGSKPKREARVAAVSGSVGFHAPERFKPPVTLTQGTQVSWASVSKEGESNVIGEPKPIEIMTEAVREPTLDGERQKVVRGLLTEAADLVTQRNVGAVILNRLEAPKPLPTVPEREFLVPRLAIFAQAALADCTPAGADQLKPLVDIIRSELPWLARQAVVTALTNWLARDPNNTARLYGVLIGKSVTPEEADQLLPLLRAYVSPTKPDPSALDRLVDLLADESIPVREAALWNIMAVKLESWVPIPFGVNVGAVGAKVNTDEYRNFVKFWKGEVEMLKKRPPPKK